MLDPKKVKNVQDRVTSRLRKYPDQFKKSVGHEFERAMTDILTEYIKAMDPEDGKEMPSVKDDTLDDFLRGTDLLMEDPKIMVLSRKIMRMDFTVGLGSKDFMPLITPPKDLPILLPDGTLQKIDRQTHRIENDPYNRGIVPIDAHRYIRFGIRIGCSAHCFEEPVVVAGLYSDRDMLPDDAYDATLALCSDVMKNAPAIISTANKVMSRYRYMTNEKYRAKIDSKMSPEQVLRAFPILVYNPKFAGQECRDFGLSRAAEATDSGEIIIRDNKVKQRDTLVPWLSEEGRLAIEAMKHTPRQFRDGMLENIETALASDYRPRGQEAPFAVNRKGEPVTEDKRPDTVKQLMKQLGKQYSHGENKLDKSSRTGPRY